MSDEIRRGTIRDVDAIAEIINLSFGDDIDRERVSHLLILSHNDIYVAELSGKMVGFVENFITISQDNRVRLELDLLAVHPSARGRGIGKILVQASMLRASELGVNCLRALVAYDNHVMQQVCKQRNMTQSEDEYGLYVRAPQATPPALVEVAKSHLIRVDTLTYRGIWLEGDITRSAITNADIIGTQNQCDILGAVVPLTDTDVIRMLDENHFEHVNNYYRWSLNLRSD